MADIINLRQVRKARARAESAATAAHNRALHGRTKQEKAAAQAEADRQRRLLDGARREDD